jgi:hypothetical protein
MSASPIANIGAASLWPERNQYGQPPRRLRSATARAIASRPSFNSGSCRCRSRSPRWPRRLRERPKEASAAIGPEGSPPTAMSYRTKTRRARNMLDKRSSAGRAEAAPRPAQPHLISKQGDRYLRSLFTAGALACDPLCQAPWHKTSAMAHGIAGAAAHQGRCHRACQQDCADGMGNDGQGRAPQPVALAA